MNTFHEQYSDEESALVRGFCRISSCCSIKCECGRTYFTTARTGGDFDEGELERLIELEKVTPDKFISSHEFNTIDAVLIDGHQIIPQCACGRAKRYLDFFESHLEELTRYCAERLEQRRKAADRECAELRSMQAMYKVTRLKVGTKIRFVKELSCGPTGDHPALLFAEKDSTGFVSGHNNHEGHMVTTDLSKSTFGACYGTEFIEVKE